MRARRPTRVSEDIGPAPGYAAQVLSHSDYALGVDGGVWGRGVQAATQQMHAVVSAPINERTIL